MAGVRRVLDRSGGQHEWDRSTGCTCARLNHSEAFDRTVLHAIE